MAQEYRFDVFGRIVAIADIDGEWVAFYLGQDGKRRRADFPVPRFIERDELAQYLGDLFHEDATPARPSVVPLFPV
ncbi:MAG TPA: hypothetical protein VN289_01975 [Paraburkholderia sp.]|jgi:hypothetical protein|nr:hypothetical protein [Paraburkholderia sp.]